MHYDFATLTAGIERGWLSKLEALRHPGEGEGETIIRLVAMEAGGRPRRRGAELFAKSRPVERRRGWRDLREWAS
jgi:hypothetical protein